jgi:hypothetical protein
MIDALLGRPMDYESLKVTVEDLLSKNDRLTLENAKLYQEVVYLRRRVHQRERQFRLIQAAHADALIMATWYIAGLSISRRDCLNAGMPVRRWARARALLDMARLLDGWGLTTTHTNTIQRQLKGALVRAQSDPHLYRLRLRKY